MKRLDYLQQKLPLLLHRAGMLEGSDVLVCPISHRLPIFLAAFIFATKQLADRDSFAGQLSPPCSVRLFPKISGGQWQELNHLFLGSIGLKRAQL
jgi:hypothetical protein